MNYASTIYYESADKEIAVPNSRLYAIEEDSLKNYKRIDKYAYLYKKIFVKSK